MRHLKVTKPIRIVLIISIIFIVLSVTFSFLFYRSIKYSEDPRINGVNSEYKTYSHLLKKNDYPQILNTLNHIESIYQGYDDYKNSFETGIVHNNKAVNWLSMAIVEKNDSAKLFLLDSAKFSALKSISTFEKWMKEFSSLSRNEIIIKIEKYYNPGDSIYLNRNIVNIINKRADEITKAQKETPKQLSLAYTNLGSVYQYCGDYKLALRNNRKALEIWHKNQTAKDNISKLKERIIK